MIENCSLRTLQDRNWAMEEECFSTHDKEAPYYFAFRVLCEAGEMGNTINKLTAYRKGSIAVLREDLKKEIGDILVFLGLTASQLDIDLQECFETVLRRNSQRVELGYYGKLQKPRGGIHEKDVTADE